MQITQFAAGPRDFTACAKEGPERGGKAPGGAKSVAWRKSAECDTIDLGMFRILYCRYPVISCIWMYLVALLILRSISRWKSWTIQSRPGTVWPCGNREKPWKLLEVSWTLRPGRMGLKHLVPSDHPFQLYLLGGFRLNIRPFGNHVVLKSILVIAKVSKVEAAVGYSAANCQRFQGCQQLSLPGWAEVKLLLRTWFDQFIHVFFVVCLRWFVFPGIFSKSKYFWVKVYCQDLAVPDEDRAGSLRQVPIKARDGTR